MDENPYQSPIADPSEPLPREPDGSRFRMDRLALLFLIVVAIFVAIALFDQLVVEFIRRTTPQPKL